MRPSDEGQAITPQALRQALAIHPDDGKRWLDLGISTQFTAALRRAGVLSPDDPDVLGGLASSDLASLDLDLAGVGLRCALALAPGRADFLQMLSHLAYCRRKAQVAICTARRSLAIDGNFESARRSLRFAQLLAGDFTNGLAAFASEARPLPAVPLPLWKGEPIIGQSLLVLGEEGFGDMIQMARYLSIVARLTSRVTVAVPAELARLFASIAGVSVVSGDISPMGFDVWIPMLALPGMLVAAGEVALPPQPYLAPPMAGPVLPPRKGMRVGIAWQGRPTHIYDRRRSIPFPSLSPIFGLPGLDLIALQPGTEGSKLAAVSLRDFADTAFVMAQLDLVVSVDTATAHLAGALGRPTWILLGDTPEWRWGTDGDECAWYPSARLYRRNEGEPWLKTVDRVACDIAEIVGGPV